LISKQHNKACGIRADIEKRAILCHEIWYRRGARSGGGAHDSKKEWLVMAWNWWRGLVLADAEEGNGWAGFRGAVVED